MQKAILALCLGLALACASTPPAGAPGTAGLPPDPNLPPVLTPPVQTGPTAGQRAASAVEGLLMGAIIGGQAGPIGAAVGGVTMLVYSAITGQVPFSGGGGGGGGAYPRGGGAPTQREVDLEQQIEAEVARQDSLEDQIESELRRQEELLREIERDDTLQEAEAAKASAVPTPEEVAALADPRQAPSAPELRELPASIFDEEHRTIRAGDWDDNSAPVEVVVRSLDADRDGAPEEIRYLDPTSDALLRKENDEDYDGAIDTWISYDSGIPAEVRRDTNGDGKPDEWETYGRDGRMATREVDRDHDGTRDAFYRFENASLVEERHDADSSGSVDRTILYQDRQILRTEEDTTGNGQVDTWTHYRRQGDEEVVHRLERDTSGDGRADTFETYEQVAGRPVLQQRDEDRNGDGDVDVRSYYEGGKLKSREINDPSLLPL